MASWLWEQCRGCGIKLSMAFLGRMLCHISGMLGREKFSPWIRGTRADASATLHINVRLELGLELALRSKL